MRLHVCLFLLLCLIGAVPGLAQDAPPPGDLPMLDIYTADSDVLVPSSIRWSADGSALYFRDESSGALLRYTIISGERVLLDADPQTVTLSAEEQAQYRAASSSAQTSPDGRFMVYASQQQVSIGVPNPENPIGYVSVLALGFRERGEYTLLRVAPLADYRVLWSADTRALVIARDALYGDGTDFVYVSDYDPAGGAVGAIRFPTETLLPGAGRTGETLFDLAADATRALVPVYSPDFTGTRGVTLWAAAAEPRYPNLSASPAWQTYPAQTAGGALLPGGSTALLVTADGLIEYDFSSGSTVRVLNPQINTGWVRWAVFSPDRAQVALLGSSVPGSDPIRGSLLRVAVVGG